MCDYIVWSSVKDVQLTRQPHSEYSRLTSNKTALGQDRPRDRAPFTGPRLGAGGDLGADLIPKKEANSLRDYGIDSSPVSLFSSLGLTCSRYLLWTTGYLLLQRVRNGWNLENRSKFNFVSGTIGNHRK
ncbi:hypothetical protein RRG08_006692 [Elysia crispata]|uniref:Uncharacterized protein n=1 Tax=Elysia crispata TaxID=231223 RepID=A0AAE1D5I6_9GAST|nr:hypothetical protein RRG08_006692 [Elysia crispata]